MTSSSRKVDCFLNNHKANHEKAPIVQIYSSCSEKDKEKMRIVLVLLDSFNGEGLQVFFIRTLENDD